MDEPVIPNPWHALRRFTAARIALGRTGVSQPTEAQLAFQLAHAQARDAVHRPLETQQLARALDQALASFGVRSLCLHSAAAGRAVYLQRPDLGRQLAPPSRDALLAALAGQDHPAPFELAIVVADGLSALAVEQNALPLLQALLPLLAPCTLAPLTIVSQARVALGDEVGQLTGAAAVLVLIGERPGLSSPDSMGMYLTWAPKVGLTDERRNCVSNVRPAGLNYAVAATKLHYLLSGARQRQLTGVGLKDETTFDAAGVGGPARNFLL
ncbi:MAG: ethanolamine ammonia-lyase subunit EutC [Pseudomonadota bacterium]